jgi:hypothetical protein
MAEAEDCVHVVALNASRKTIVAIRESLDTKTTDAKVYATLKQVDGFYEIALAQIKQEQESGYPCQHCWREHSVPLVWREHLHLPFDDWTNHLTVEAIAWTVEIMRESA